MTRLLYMLLAICSTIGNKSLYSHIRYVNVNLSNTLHYCSAECRVIAGLQSDNSNKYNFPLMVARMFSIL